MESTPAHDKNDDKNKHGDAHSHPWIDTIVTGGRTLADFFRITLKIRKKQLGMIT